MNNLFVPALLILLALISPPPCLANAGVPMMALMAVPMWGLLIVIVPFEAFLAEKILSLPRLQAHKLSATANAVSTIAGVPLTWGALVGCEMLVSQTPLMKVQWDGPGKFIFFLITAPWLWPFGSDMYWMAPGAALLLLVPFFFASFWTEYFTGKMLFRDEDPKKIKLWAWKANCISYAFMFFITTIWLTVNIVNHQTRANNDEHRNVDQVSAERLWELAMQKPTSQRFHRDVPGHKERYKGRIHRPMEHYYWDARYELENGHQDKAEKILRDGLAVIDSADYQSKTSIDTKAGDSLNVTNELASLYFKQGRFADAIPVYERLVRLEDERLPSLVNDSFVISHYPEELAIAYQKVNKPQQAEKFYKHALSQKAKFAPKDDRRALLIAYADFCNKQGRTEEAEKLYLTAAANRKDHNYPDDQNPQMILAKFLAEKKQFSRAEEILLAEIQYQQAHDEFGEFPSDRFIAPMALQLGKLYLEQGKLEKAEHYIKLSMRGTKLSDSAMSYSQLLKKKGEVEQAKAWQKRSENVKNFGEANSEE